LHARYLNVTRGDEATIVVRMIVHDVELTGTLIGLFEMTAPGVSVAQDWAELTAGIRLPAWSNGTVTASLTASVPSNYPITYAPRLGFTQAF
jgi:hypothetical protein